MPKEIQLCLVYRDMWQSSGKYMPRVDQLLRVAGPIIEMGCFSRVETNGGGFEQINLLFGENPNHAVRQWTQPFNDAGIQTQMLERGLNGIRMYPVSREVRRLMFKVKKKQGTDIARSFDGLNDTRNIIDSIQYAKEGGMIAQAALCITHSPLHTADYYIQMARTLIEGGADEIAIKDMAGIGRPVTLGRIVAGIKADYPNMLVQYHGHSGPGFSVATALEVARAGADIIDVGMEPLSWGTAHADLLTIHETLRDAGFSLPDINMDAYMKVRALTQEFIDDFLGFYINPRNRFMNSLLIGPGLPGGMMGSLMADLENNLSNLNKWMRKRNQPELTQEALLIHLFKEVEHIWPQMGYPPLVTPYSQYVKNVALMNVMQMLKGKERWSMVDDNTWDMLLGKAGQLPGPLSESLKSLARAQGREFYEGHPQDLYPDDLESYRQEMHKEGWDLGEDEEELLELAMHPKQYKAYRSGKAKADFEADLEKRKAANAAKASTESTPAPPVSTGSFQPQSLTITVEGIPYKVGIQYGEADNGQVAQVQPPKSPPSPVAPTHDGGGVELTAPLEGTFLLTKDNGETPVKVGDQVQAGQVVCYIEAMKVVNAVTADQGGTVLEICARSGEAIDEDEVIMRIQP